MIKFKDRKNAGRLLADKLKKYKKDDLIVFGIPRGGIVVASEIAKKLNSPLELLITKKIGHPTNSEFAVAAISEAGYLIKNSDDIDIQWLSKRIAEEKLEAKRRRIKYQIRKNNRSLRNKIAILVDDGAATGLTLHVAIMELRGKKPKKIIVAIPVIIQSTAEIIGSDVNKIIALHISKGINFRGSVGAYFENFEQINDLEVIKILKSINR